MRLLSRNEIEKLAQVIRARNKTAVAAPTIGLSGNAAGVASNPTFSLAPAVTNPLGTAKPNSTTKGLKTDSTKPVGG